MGFGLSDLGLRVPYRLNPLGLGFGEIWINTAWVWRGKLVPGVCKRDVLVFGGAEGSLCSKVAGRPTAGLRYQRQGSRINKFFYQSQGGPD